MFREAMADVITRAQSGVRPKTFTVRYTFDPDSRKWLVSIDQLPRVHTHGRSLGQAKARAAEAIRVVTNDDTSFAMEGDVSLPRQATAQVKAEQRLREALETLQFRFVDQTQRTLKVLTKDLGLSLRDVGTLLDYSHQRIQQLIQKPSAATKAAAPGRLRRRVALKRSLVAVQSAGTTTRDSKRSTKRPRRASIAAGSRRLRP